MKIDLIGLNSNHLKEIIIDDSYKFSNEKIKEADLLDLSSVKINGRIYKDSLGDYIIDVMIEGIMTLPCAITLKPVKHEFKVNVCDNLYTLLTEIDENTKKVENSIDILPIIWENILMEIPMKVVSDDAQLSNLEGNGWKLITDKEEKKINPALASLNDLLKK